MASSKKLPKNKDTVDASTYLFDTVKQQLIALFKTDGFVRPNLLVAYSGGLDSTVLLHLLSNISHSLPFYLTAMHVHHGISEHADHWAASSLSFLVTLVFASNLSLLYLFLQRRV